MNIAVKPTDSERLASGFLSRPLKNLIGGRWVEAQSGKTFEVHNPADGSVIARVADSGKADVDMAVAAARKAFEEGPWSTMTPTERAKLLFKLADAIEAHADELALIETLDNGKPYKMARMGDVPGSAEKFRYFGGWCTKITGQTVNSNRPGDFHLYTLREPVGVCGLITPWNFPLAAACVKLAPALAAGCTVILKPAEQTPLSALRLGEIFQEVGFPDGVVNIVTGFGETAGAPITEHPGVDKVSFTGSTEVGKLIVRAATGNLKRVTLELGGKSPIIIFPDADLEKAIPAAANGIFFNAGQVCAASSRLYAHKDVFDRVVEGVARRAEQLKVGPGVNADTDLGPLVSQEQIDRVGSYLQAGVASGATLVTGGKRLEGSGYFVQPTVFANTSEDMSIQREEIFGPVLTASSFSDADLDRIAKQANDSDYGLSAYMWTQNISTAHKLAKKLRAGDVHINSFGLDNALPFGGYKQSGWGRENGSYGIEPYLETKSVMVGL